MKIFLVNLIILLVSGLVKSNNEYVQSAISNELENSNLAPFKEMEGQWYAYCFNIIQPVLEHTVSIQEKEKLIQEQSIIIKNLEKQLADLQIKVGIHEETINNNDLKLAQQIQFFEKTKNETIDKFEGIIKDKTLQLAQQLLTSEKCQNETIEKNNMIASRDEKLIEYKVKMENSLASSCMGKLNDVYEIKVPGMEAFSVPCDSSLAGSGWTVIQRRKDGSVNFNRNWTDYREGFGDLRGEFFIGLEKLHLMTKSQNYELYIYLQDFENQERYARYTKFLIADEVELYKIKALGTYSGDAADSMDYHKDMKFATPDRDHNNCAKKHKSGWWFSNCFMSNLNGIYDKNATERLQLGIKWNQWQYKSLKFVQMMIRPN